MSVLSVPPRAAPCFTVRPQEGQQADLQLYWANKMRTPILEVFEAAAPPAAHASLVQARGHLLCRWGLR